MTVENKYFAFTVQALEDLNSHQYQAIALDDGKVANDGDEAIGILLNKPKNTEFASVGITGILKYRAGEAVAIHKPLTVATSGYITGAGSGDYIVGRALAAVTSGSIGKGVFDFTKPIYAMSSSFAW